MVKQCSPYFNRAVKCYVIQLYGLFEVISLISEFPFIDQRNEGTREMASNLVLEG